MWLRRQGEPPAIIAHRGFSAAAPENTLAAIELAIATGAVMVEVDVGFSADEGLVLIHDDHLDRTTSGYGPVRAQPLEKLRALDAGSWFAPRFAGEKIPLLEEALELVRGRIAINLEIKGESVDDRRREQTAGEIDPNGIEARVLREVRQRGLLDQVLFSSFHPLALWRLRRLEPAAQIASLLHAPYHGGRRPEDILAEVGSTALHVHDSEAQPELIEACAAAAIPLRVYTVNSPARFLALAPQAIDAVFTDDPAALQRAAANFR